jgi:ribosomal protein S18 acetylase RimI-like enzyme
MTTLDSEVSWTSGDIKVREARALDALPVLSIHRAVLDEGDYFITRADEFDTTMADKEELIVDLAAAPNAVFLIARRQRQVVGFLTIQGGRLQRMKHVGKLEVMVSPAARGAGVGKALMIACLDWAENNDMLEKVGLAVFETNSRAIALYHSFGFEEEGRRPREYRMEDGEYRDDLLMYRFV